MYCASPRTPCSGPKSAASRTRGAAWRRSAAWTSPRVTAVGLQTRPTVRPASGRKPRAARTSRPGTTAPPAPRRARPGAPARAPRRRLAPEREAERVAARLVLRVRRIAEVPVGAGADVPVVHRVLEHLDERRRAGGADGDAELQGAGE